MSKLNVSSVVSAYIGIPVLEAGARKLREDAERASRAVQEEARKRRADVVKLVIQGHLSKSAAADLIGITESGVIQLVHRYKAEHSDLLSK